MKTTIISCFCVCLASCALSQGTIHFANDASSLILFSHGIPVSGVPISTGGVQLAWAPEGAQWRPAHSALEIEASPGWHVLGPAVNVGAPGRFDGGTLTIPTAAPGGTVQLAMLVWATPFPNSPLADFSPPFTVDTGNPLLGEEPASIVGPGKFPGFTVAIVPEPSSISMLALGGAMLLLRRRRTP